MPSKSDSAGKLHQYYTVVSLNMMFTSSKLVSPLSNEEQLNFHKASFNQEEILSLEKIGELSARIISEQIDNIILIKDIGVNSGASSHENTDDIEVHNSNGSITTYSLKCAKGINQILSKNMGAKSLIKQYFKNVEEQNNFNALLDRFHLEFLNSSLSDMKVEQFSNISKAKKTINELARDNNLSKARFSDKIFNHANNHRDTFLKLLRDNLLIIINRLKPNEIINASNLILDTGKNHILADYRKNKETVKFSNIPVKKELDIKSIQSRGNDSVEIVINDHKIGFRFKFESGLTSSIKLVGDYKKI